MAGSTAEARRFLHPTDSRPQDPDPGPTAHRNRQSQNWSATRFVGRGMGTGWVPEEVATVVARVEWVAKATVTAVVAVVAARLGVVGAEDWAKAQTGDLAMAVVNVEVTDWAEAGQVAEAMEDAAAAAAWVAKEETCQCIRWQDACPTCIERRRNLSSSHQRATCRPIECAV